MSEIDELRREVAELRAEMNRVDDWANGVFAALLEVVLPLVKSHPDIADVLRKTWRPAAERWERMQGDTGQAEDFHETAELLEPRKMLYQTLVGIGAFPPPWTES